MTSIDAMQSFAHRHGTILATERHGEWLIIYTRDSIDGDGMAFRTLDALAARLGY